MGIYWVSTMGQVVLGSGIHQRTKQTNLFPMGGTVRQLTKPKVVCVVVINAIGEGKAGKRGGES